VAQALGQRRGGQQRIFAFAQVVVVEVERKREHVDGEGVGKGRLFVVFAGALVEGHGCAFGVVHRVEGAAARFPGVLAGFTANAGLRLRPGEGGKAFRHAGGVDEVVRHVDEELEGQAEAVFDESRREKHSLNCAERHVAMADGAVAQIYGVAGRDDSGRFAGAFGNDQRYEKVGAFGDGRSQRARNGADQALQIGVTDAGFAPGGVVDPVGRFGDGGGCGDLVRGPRDRGSGGLGGGFRGGRHSFNRDRHNSLY
jgi:hypothetical protein